jgi:hypothetical protein
VEGSAAGAIDVSWDQPVRAPIIPAAQTPGLRRNDLDLPDMLDGSARKRRVGLLLGAIAVLVLGAAIIGAIVSQMQPR